MHFAGVVYATFMRGFFNIKSVRSKVLPRCSKCRYVYIYICAFLKCIVVTLLLYCYLHSC